MGLLAEPFIVHKLVLGGDRETGILLETVDIIRINRVAALAGSKGKSGADKTAEAFIITDIKPALAIPADIFVAYNRIGKVHRVRTVFFPSTYVNIADDLLASFMEEIDGFLRRLKKIEFEHIRFSG